jgi:polysaccharide biosynthesis transport protein
VVSQSDGNNSPANLPAPAPVAPPVANGVILPPAGPYSAGWGAGVPGQATLAPTLNALSLLLALRRRWVLALVLGLLGGAAAAVAAWFITPPPTYRARAMVHLAISQEHLIPGRQFHDSPFDQKTQISVVKSQLVLNAALKQPQVAQLSTVVEKPSALEWLTKELEVDFSMGPEVLSISLSGDRPEELVTLVNAVMKAYLDGFVNEEDKKRRERLEHLKELRTQHESILRAKQKILERFAPKLGAGDPKNAQVWFEMKVKHLGLAKEQLFAVQTQIRTQEIDLKGQEQARERAKSGVDITDAMVEQAIESDPQVQRHHNKIAEIQEYIANLLSVVPSAEARDNLLRKTGKQGELDGAQRALEARRQELLPKKRKELQDKLLSDFDVNIAQVRYQIVLKQEEEKMLSKVIDDLAGETHDVGKDEFDLGLARREAEEEDKIVQTLAQNIQGLEIDLLAPSRARPLDEAIATKVNGPKKRLLIAGGVGGLGLALAMLAVAFWEFLSRRVKSVDEVAYGLGVRLVGTLPAVPARERGRPLLNSPAAARWETHFTESVDSYRTMLLHEARVHSIRVVMVTSAVSGEGKTSLASHLVVSLARAGSNALLVDCDLRNPSAHLFFGLSRGPGLSELLRGEVDVAAAVRPTPTGGGWIMTAGDCDLRAVQCLGGDGLRSLFDQLRQQFDFVVVDSPPVLSVADSLLVGQHADGVIFSVLYDVSRMPSVAAAQHRLAMLGIPTLGAVVIGTGENVYSPKYHYPLPAHRQLTPG